MHVSDGSIKSNTELTLVQLMFYPCSFFCDFCSHCSSFCPCDLLKKKNILGGLVFTWKRKLKKVQGRKHASQSVHSTHHFFYICIMFSIHQSLTMYDLEAELKGFEVITFIYCYLLLVGGSHQPPPTLILDRIMTTHIH